MVVVGSVAYDGVETPHGKVERMLGGACTYIALSASFFTEPRIVAVVGDDFEEKDYDLLASRGIDLTGLQRVPGKTFFWSGVYSQDMNDRETLTTELNVFADFDPKLPESYKSAPYLLLGNIQPALQRAVKAQMNGSLRLVGGDTMNYWIADFREELLKTIAEWDFLLINDSEARMLSGENNLQEGGGQDSWRWVRRSSSSNEVNTAQSCGTATAISWCLDICWRMSSIPPGRAIASPADSWAIWPGKASI